MKLSDYVIGHLTHHGVTRVFGMSGSAEVHRSDLDPAQRPNQAMRT